MFSPCAPFQGKNTPLFAGCTASYLWGIGLTLVMLLVFLIMIFKLLRASIIQKRPFWQNLREMLYTPVGNSFCSYISDSPGYNCIFYYTIMFVALYGDCMLKILPTLAGSGMTTGSIILRSLVPASRGGSLYAWFLVLEIIHLRYYTIRTNRANLLTAAVDTAERRIVIRFILLKSLLFTLPIFIAEEILTFEYFEIFKEACTWESLFYFVRFLEFTLVFCMTIPRISFLYYEKRRQTRSEALSRDRQILALLSKHLNNLAMTPESAENLIKELTEAGEHCSLCLQSGGRIRICSHSIGEVITSRIMISYTLFQEQKEIAQTRLAAMLVTNPRDNVGRLKIALVFLTINSLLIAISYLVLALAIENEVDIMQGGFNWMRIICCIINLAVVPWLNIIVLNPELSFGSFHHLFEQEEFQETTEIKRQQTKSGECPGILLTTFGKSIDSINSIRTSITPHETVEP